MSVRRLSLLLLLFIFAGCTPQQVLMSAMVPDGTASMVLSHLQNVEDGNRRRIAELEQRRDWAGLAKFAEDNISRDPFSPEWRLIGGYAWSQAGDYPRAAGYFGEMVRLSPDDVTAYHFLAGAQRAAGQQQRALVTLERARLVTRESPVTDFLLGEVNAELGRGSVAVMAYRRALATDPMQAGAWFGMGRESLKLGLVGDAREALRSLQQLRSPQAAELDALIRHRSGISGKE